MNEANAKKMRWLRPTLTGDDATLMQQLLDTLPATDALDEGGQKQLEQARLIMSDLFMRHVALNRFFKDTGMTGFPVYPEQAGMHRQQPHNATPCYYDFFLLDKDVKSAVAAIKNTLVFRKQGAGDYANVYVMQVFVDIDTESAQFPMPYDGGLTPNAVCFEFGLGDAETAFAGIEKACAKLIPKAQRNIRFGLGTFAGQEYEGFSKGSLFSKRIPFCMGMEWILFKNVHKRAGKFGWFWNLVARNRDRNDN